MKTGSLVSPPASARCQVASQPSSATRLDVAKDVLVDFVRRRKTDRIGVVVFAKQAFVLSPPTLDYGLIACRRAVPGIGELADYVVEAHQELHALALQQDGAPNLRAVPPAEAAAAVAAARKP